MLTTHHAILTRLATTRLITALLEEIFIKSLLMGAALSFLCLFIGVLSLSFLILCDAWIF